MKCAGIEFVTSDRIEAQELARSCSWAETLTTILHDVNELAQAKKRAKKPARGQEYNPKAVLGSLRRDCARARVDLWRACARSTRAPARLSQLIRGKDEMVVGF